MAMKRSLTGLVATLFLFAALCAPLAGVRAAEEEAGWSRTTALTDTVALTKGVFAVGDDRQQEHYISYTPGGAVRPALCYGQKLTDKLAFPEAAALVSGEGARAVAGVNADYYVIATNVPLGLVVREGELISSDAGLWALGFAQDGSAFFGKPALNTRLTFGGESYRLGGVNKSILDSDFFLYTDTYGEKTGVSEPARNVVLIPEEGAALSANCTLTLTVESNYKSPGAIEIPQGKLILCLTEDSDGWRKGGMEALKPGDKLTLEISAEACWSDCLCATGCLYKLLTNGEVEPGLDDADKNKAPRTAVGVRADGTVLFYTVDGRQGGYSAGLTLDQAARRLLALGCVEAGAMDGGGSTVLRGQNAGEGDCALVNRPSSGKEREVTSFLMLCGPAEGSGLARTLTLRTEAAAVLAGGQARFTAGACDETGAPVAAEPLHWSADDGTIDAEGLFTAPDYDCEALVRVSAAGLEDSLALRVLRTPADIRIVNEQTGRTVTELNLGLGETVELAARATWKRLDVAAEDSQFSWSCEGNAGTVSAEGLFTASATGGVGTVTARAGDCSFTVGVTVKSEIMRGADFEVLEPGEAEGVVWSQERSMDRVRFGRGSAKLSYDLTEGGAAFPLDLSWGGIAKYAIVWVYGDGSGNELLAEHENGTASLGILDYTGWKLMRTETGRYGGIRALRIEGEGQGEIWLDQLLLTDYSYYDFEPPVLRLTVDGQNISGRATDRHDGCLETEHLTLTLDGAAIPFSYDEVTGEVSAVVEETGLLGRVTLSAGDKSGNRISISAEAPGAAENPFPDMEEHWAKDYAAYLSAMGVIQGKPDEAGETRFDPDAPVTRGEFAVMLCRWLDIDLAPYAETEAAFTDAGKFPAWAANSIKAVSALGIVQGMPDGEGMAFRGGESLTRAQAATILGRTQEGGRKGADLVFTDAHAIPKWSLKYVSELVFMGALKGFEDGSFAPDGPLTRAQAAKILTELT